MAVLISRTGAHRNSAVGRLSVAEAISTISIAVDEQGDAELCVEGRQHLNEPYAFLGSPTALCDQVKKEGRHPSVVPPSADKNPHDDLSEQIVIIVVVLDGGRHSLAPQDLRPDELLEFRSASV